MRTRPFPKWPVVTEAEIAALAEVGRSGVWGGGLSEQGEEFSRRFADYHGVDFAIQASNGSTALEIPLRNAGIGHGDEVITPPTT